MTWVCGQCTTVNGEDLEQCAVCGGEKVTAPTLTDGFPAPSVTPPAARSIGSPQVEAPDPTVVVVPPPGSGEEVRRGAAVTGRSPWLIVMTVVGIGLVMGVASFLWFSDDQGLSTSGDDAGSRSSGGREPGAERPVQTSSEREDRYAEDDADVDVVTVTSPSTTTTAPVALERRGSLFAGEAVLRGTPSLDGAEVNRYRGREGMGLEVLAEPDANGWYRVRMDDQEGFLFGAFVLPPSPGFCVGETVSRQAPVVYIDGVETAAEKSGARVLLTSGSADLGEVILPGGQRGVTHDAIEIVECGSGGVR